MKEIFKFKLKDGTIVTGANPVEALMNVPAKTTGQNLEKQFKKTRQEAEDGEGRLEFEKLLNEYLELEKKIRGEKL